MFSLLFVVCSALVLWAGSAKDGIVLVDNTVNGEEEGVNIEGISLSVGKDTDVVDE
jgi:hypothetical protein